MLNRRTIEIGRNHPHIDATSKKVSGINILQKTFIVLLSHLNRLNNTWVGSIFIVSEIVASLVLADLSTL